MAAPKPVDHRHSGPYNRPAFQEQFTAQFAKGSRYNAAAMPDMLVLSCQTLSWSSSLPLPMR